MYEASLQRQVFVSNLCVRNFMSFTKDYEYQFHHIEPVKIKTYPLFLGNAAFLYLISTAILPLEQGMVFLQFTSSGWIFLNCFLNSV